MSGLRRLRHAEFKRRLDQLCHQADGKPASSNKTLKKEQNREAANREWWLANQGKCGRYDTPRYVAYLKAYIELAEPIFYATGIPLVDGYLYPDRGIMKAMLLADCVVLNEQDNRFELTDRGRDLLASA